MIAAKKKIVSGEQLHLSIRADALSEDKPRTDRDSKSTVYASAEPNGCGADNCAKRGVGVLALQRLCIHHFIVRCFEGLRVCGVPGRLDRTEATSESTDTFVRECILETVKLLQNCPEIDHVRRGHLVDVFLWASELAVKRCADAA